MSVVFLKKTKMMNMNMFFHKKSVKSEIKTRTRTISYTKQLAKIIQH